MRRALLGVLLLLPPGHARAQSPVLDAYVQAGLESNLTLRQREIDVLKRMEQLNEARALFLPGIGIEARYTVADGGRAFDIPTGDLLNPVYATLNELLEARGEPGRFPTIDNQRTLFLRPREQETRVRVTQPLFDLRIWHNRQAQKHLVESERAGLDAFRLRLARDIRHAYFDYRNAERAVRIWADAHDLVLENERVAERLFAAESVTRDAVYRSRAERFEVEQSQAAAERDRDVARAYLNFLVNRPLDTPVDPDPGAADLSDIPFTAEGPPDAVADSVALRAWADSLADLARLRRPELDQLSAASDAASSAAAIEASGLVPSLALAVDGGIQGETYAIGGGNRFVFASLVLRWNLGDFGRGPRAEQSRLEARRLGAERAELARSIDFEVERATRDLLVAWRTLATADRRVEEARQGFRIASRRRDEGLAPQVVFLDARSTLTRAELNRSITETDLLKRLAELDYITGAAPLTYAHGGEAR